MALLAPLFVFPAANKEEPDKRSQERKGKGSGDKEHLGRNRVPRSDNRNNRRNPERDEQKDGQEPEEPPRVIRVSGFRCCYIKFRGAHDVLSSSNFYLWDRAGITTTPDLPLYIPRLSLRRTRRVIPRYEMPQQQA